MSDTPHILIVDDDTEILDLLSKYLRSQGFEVTEASSVGDFRRKLALKTPDMVVLDIMLPDGSGLETCRDLRLSGFKTPIILLTAVTEEVDRILGLEFGADDYIGKPFNPRELVARIRAVLRRVGEAPTAAAAREQEKAGVYRFDGFTCDPSVRGVYDKNGTEVQLTGAEFDLLHVFLDRPQRLISRETLLELTNKSLNTFDTTINVLISRIRKKLSAAGAPDEMFRTVRNGGYQLTTRVERA
ncbi:response regulator transcription factor [Rhizobium laguerreae]|uniref:response regulator transcription factor n=1 Tax=Rhizobium laguerreae TaxID=1076926 RepID=UPI001C914662|nr:response regulator transcription factor [Rhizobium laguerreae]MBY3155411.1 response regulator transcription factor [Rhizobium laguerreae]MBY3433924.1 response regulator transcription factor [Rhizobium laguerreae]